MITYRLVVPNVIVIVLSDVTYCRKGKTPDGILEFYKVVEQLSVEYSSDTV
jgi:hypothetical protein